MESLSFMWQRRASPFAGVVMVLLGLALIALSVKDTNRVQNLELYEVQTYPVSVVSGQQLATQSSLANYLVKGNIDLPEAGSVAPPQGIVMQFPGAEEAAEENDEDDDEKVPKVAKQSEKEAKRQANSLERELERTKEKSEELGRQIRELQRFVRDKTDDFVRQVQANNQKLTIKIEDVPPTPGPRGPTGLPGIPGKNGLNGQQGASGPPGVEGLAGLAGSRGAPGPEGNQGAPGDYGPQGAQGSQGAVGISGRSGDIMG